jgi:hypothetical protein
LGVRLFGVWEFVQAVAYTESFIEVKLGMINTPFNRESSPVGYLLFATIDLALAALFLLWTRKFVDWSYGEDPANKSVTLGENE